MPFPLFNARYQIFSASPGGTADFVTDGLFFDETSIFTAGEVLAGDYFYDSFGHLYEIAVVNSFIPLNCDVIDLESEGAPAGACSIYRPTETAQGTPVPTRITNGITEFLQNHMRNVSIQDSNTDDEIETFTLTAPDIANGYVTLARIPDDPESVKMFLANAGNQLEGFAWQLLGQNVDWNGLSLDGVLVVGNVIQVTYR